MKIYSKMTENNYSRTTTIKSEEVLWGQRNHGNGEKKFGNIVAINVLAASPGEPCIPSKMQDYTGRTQCREGKITELYNQMQVKNKRVRNCMIENVGASLK